MKSLFYSSLLILLCGACASNTERVDVITTFGETGTLTAVVRKVPEPILLPRFMGIANNQLFVYKEKEDKLFEFFTLPDCFFLGSAGGRGQGPNEFGLLDTRSFRTSENDFSVVEAGSNLLKRVVFEDSCLTVTYTERVFEQGAPNNGFYLLKDSTYLTLGNIIESNEYCLLNKKTGDITKVGSYPQWTANQANKDNSLTFFNYLKSCVVHPDGDKFAAFYSYFKRLRIYNHAAALLHDIDIKIKPCSTNFQTGAETNEQPVYYIGQPQATKNYIYALCSNAKGSGLTVPSDCELHVFDWEGKAIACYKFDRRVSLIALSEKYNKIIALNNRIADELYIYDLPKHK